jgi:hypothetical protein
MPTNIFDMTDTWNNVGTTFNGIKMNVSNSASAAASKLLDLQVGSVSEFSIAPDGIATGETPTAGTTVRSLQLQHLLLRLTRPAMRRSLLLIIRGLG